MASNRLFSPSEFITWIKTENDPVAIHQYLAQLKEINYANTKNIDLSKHDDVICYALTTRKIKGRWLFGKPSVTALEDALNAISPSEIVQYIQMIVQALQAIINYIESHSLCKSSSQTLAAQRRFTDQLLRIDGSNPFMNLSGVEIDNTDLSNRNFRFVDFSHARLCNVNFTGTNLEYVNFNGARLNNVRLDGANLKGADLRWTDLEGTGAKIDGPVDLKAFLQTNYPADVQLSKLPTPADLEAALTQIRLEFEGEKHMNLLTQNIMKTARLLDAKTAVAFLDVAIQHSIYTDHLRSKIMDSIDKAVTKVHNKLFHDQDARTLGTINQTKLINLQKDFAHQLLQAKEASVQPVVVQPR